MLHMVSYRYMIMKAEISNKTEESRRIAIQNLEALPTIPLVLTRVLEIVKDKNSSAKDLAQLVSNDQSLMSILLKLVNSAFYGHMRKISSIHQATVILGFNTVKSIALGATIFQPEKTKAIQNRIDRKALWLHSLATAQTSKLMAQIVSYPDPDEAFIGGLLHDLGKVVLDICFKDDFQEAYLLAKKGKKQIIEIEKEIIGLDHAEAGHILLTKWQLPITISEGIRCHHSPMQATVIARNLASIIHIANHIVRKLNIGTGKDEAIQEIDPQSIKTLNLSEPDIKKITDEMEEKREEIERFGSS